MYSKLFPVTSSRGYTFPFLFPPLVYKQFLILRLCALLDGCGQWVEFLALPVSEWKLRAYGDATFTIIRDLSQLASIS